MPVRVYRKAPVTYPFPLKAISKSSDPQELPVVTAVEAAVEAKRPVRSVPEDLYRGQERVSGISTRKDDTPSEKKGFKYSHMARIVPAVFVTIGSMLLANVLWPIVSYQFFVSPTLQKSSMISPMTQEKTVEIAPPVLPVTAAEPLPTPKIVPVILDEELDYTNLAAWFPTQTLPEIKPEEAKMYSIDIPALDVKNAEVKVGGLNLDKSLVQFPGTANPGELGSPVIFGHSVSPLFYNPSEKNPKRYISIFTKIMQLKQDDVITVKYDGITYTYRVTKKMEVKPDDVEILRQNYDSKQLKLITCTPPGTYMKRGIVFAQLENVQ